MGTHANKTKENKNHSVTNDATQKQSSINSPFQFADYRPDAIAQRKLQEIANNRPLGNQVSQLQPVIQRGVGASKVGGTISRKVVTYQTGQITNTTLSNLMRGKLLKSKVLTHGTNARRNSLRGEVDTSKKTNVGTTGEYVHFFPSWRNDYGNYIYVFDRDNLNATFSNGEYRQLGEVSTDLSLGYYTQLQMKDVNNRLLLGEDLEHEKD